MVNQLASPNRGRDRMIVYLDESKSGDHSFIGYGCLIAHEGMADAIIGAALERLNQDPDTKDPRCSEMDKRTLSRRLFHAADDSKNAHSHLCTEINRQLRGDFASHVFDMTKAGIDPPTEDHAFDLTSALSSLKVFQARNPVTIVFEDREKLSAAALQRWHDCYTDQVLRSIYDHPYIPALFPDTSLLIGDKANAGLQCCDFLTWTVMRKLQGDDAWNQRLQPRFRAEATSESADWIGLDMGFGETLPEPKVNYRLTDFPTNLDSKVTHNSLVSLYINAERVLSCFAQNGLPPHMLHLDAEVRRLAQTRLDPDQRGRVTAVAKTYLKLFDTLPLLAGDETEGEREFLLLSKKYLALTLRDDLIHGVRTGLYLERVRREILQTKPTCLS